MTSASYAAFLIGLNGAGGTAAMAQALKSAVILREKFEAQVYFFTGNVKVAEEGLERLYLEGREAGVVFFKLEEEKLEWIKNGDQVTLQFIDPLLGQPFELLPDLLVIDSRPVLPAEMQSLAVSARLGMDPAGLPAIGQRAPLAPGVGPDRDLCRRSRKRPADGLHRHRRRPGSGPGRSSVFPGQSSGTPGPGGGGR